MTTTSTAVVEDLGYTGSILWHWERMKMRVDGDEQKKDTAKNSHLMTNRMQIE